MNKLFAASLEYLEQHQPEDLAARLYLTGCDIESFFLGSTLWHQLPNQRACLRAYPVSFSCWHQRLTIWKWSNLCLRSIPSIRYVFPASEGIGQDTTILCRQGRLR